MVAAVRPESWNWLLFVHLFAVFLFAGGIVVETVLGVVGTQRDRPSEVALLARAAQRVDVLVVWPSLVILVGAGAALADREGVYDKTWLGWGIALTALATVIVAMLGPWLNRRTLRRAESLVEQGTVATDELRRLGQSTAATALRAIVLAVLVLIFWLMTAKPGA